MISCALSFSSSSPPVAKLANTPTTENLIQQASGSTKNDAAWFHSEDGASGFPTSGDSSDIPHTASRDSSLTTESTGTSTPKALSSLLGGVTPQILKPPNASPDSRPLHTGGLSTSAEQYRSLPRASSALSALTASLPRRFQFNSTSSSPPDVSPRKRPSPASSYLGHTQSSLTGSVSNWMHRSSSMSQEPRSRPSPSNADIEDEKYSALVDPGPRGVTCKLKNQDQFYGCGARSLPLLDPSLEWKYRSWRQAYAGCLEAWDMPDQRNELLKYNSNISV